MNDTVEYAKHSESLTLDGFFKDLKKGLCIEVGASGNLKSPMQDYFNNHNWQVKQIAPAEALKGELNKLKSHVHVLRINAPGIEYDVLKNTNLKYFRPELICIEAASHASQQDWPALLAKNGYKQAWNDGLNDYFLAEESAERKNQFKNAEEAIAAGDLPQKDSLIKAEDLQRKLRETALQLEIEQLKSRQLQEDKQKLEAALKEQKRLRNSAKLLTKAIDRAILAEIERLKVSKIIHDVRPSGDPKPQYDESSASNMLFSIQKADILAYFTAVSKNRPAPKFYTYRIVGGTYKLVRSGFVATGRGITRLIKRKPSAKN